MKKLILVMLALAGIAPAFAQFVNMNNQQTITESLFNNPKPKSLRNNFDFNLPRGNKMTLEFSNINQFNSLVNVDSLVAVVWQNLQPLKDSLSKPLMNRRVDYNIFTTGHQIRIVEYPQTATTYRYINDELVQTKIEQDTLRIRLYAPRKQGESGLLSILPYFITLRLNHISDVETLPANSLNSAIDLLRKDLAPALNNSKTKNYRTYYAMYDVTLQKRINPLSTTNFGYGKRKYLEPYVQLGFQYLRGSWAPSAGAGFQLIHGYYNANRKAFKLYWEPYFFFSRDVVNRLAVQRNDFITFKYNEVRNRANNFPTIYSNFSLGYLISRKGNWFEENSFKFAVPGFTMRNVTLEPEFHFNKFFKNFTPSLRLTLDIE